MEPWPAGVVLRPAENGFIRIRERLVFADEVDDVDAEAICAAVEPEAHHVMGGSADGWVFPVEIWLLFAEEAEVVFVCCFVVFPGAAYCFGDENI